MTMLEGTHSTCTIWHISSLFGLQVINVIERSSYMKEEQKNLSMGNSNIIPEDKGITSTQLLSRSMGNDSYGSRLQYITGIIFDNLGSTLAFYLKYKAYTYSLCY